MNRALRKRLDRLDGQTSGKPKFALVEYDGWYMTPEQAIERAIAGGFIPAGCNLIAFPKTLTSEQWGVLIPATSEHYLKTGEWFALPDCELLPKLKFDGGKLNA